MHPKLPLPAARFTHDCTICTYVGQSEQFDLYVCGNGSTTGTRTIIARYGNEGHEYVSGDGMVYLDTPYGRVRMKFEPKEGWVG